MRTSLLLLLCQSNSQRHGTAFFISAHYITPRALCLVREGLREEILPSSDPVAVCVFVCRPPHQIRCVRPKQKTLSNKNNIFANNLSSLQKLSSLAYCSDFPLSSPGQGRSSDVADTWFLKGAITIATTRFTCTWPPSCLAPSPVERHY